jgi:Hypoxia induced protein conserved region
MHNAIFILLIILMLATAGALVAGLVVMVRGGKVSLKYSNKMMQLRVLLQALALAVFALLMWYMKK